MKRTVLFSLVCAWLTGLLLFLPGCATARPTEVPGTLYVHVDVPPHWSVFLDDRISEAFTDRVREVFHNAGFDKPVEEARLLDDADRAADLLTINLVDWRIDRIGNIECTFTAELRTPRGTKQFGVYTNTTMRWFGGFGRFGLARSFEEAADGAIGNLCHDVAQSELLPGLRTRAT